MGGKITFEIEISRLFYLDVHKERTVEEMKWLGWDEGGDAWEWRRRLLAWEDESVGECSILHHNVVLQKTSTDTWKWLLDPIDGYSV